MPTHQVPLVLKDHSLNLYCSFPLFQSYHAAAIKKSSGPAMWLCRYSESPQPALEVRARKGILIYYCPFPECNHKTPKVQSMKWHWECSHGASKAQSKELKTLPLIVDMVRNRLFRHPGNCHPLLPPGRVPAGSYSLQEKGELLVRVSCKMTPRSEVPEERRVVRIAAPPSATITTPKDPLPPSLPPPTDPLQSALQTSKEMSSPSAPTTPLQAATHPMVGAQGPMIGPGKPHHLHPVLLLPPSPPQAIQWDLQCSRIH